MRSVRSNKGTRRDVCTCFSYTAKCTPLAALRVSVQSCFASWARVGTLRLPKSAGAGLRRGTRRGAPASGRVVLTRSSLFRVCPALWTTGSVRDSGQCTVLRRMQGWRVNGGYIGNTVARSCVRLRSASDLCKPLQTSKIHIQYNHTAQATPHQHVRPRSLPRLGTRLHDN